MTAQPNHGHGRIRPQGKGAPEPQLLLTVDEAAERLGIGRSTMYGLILDGAVESVRIGRLRRVPADALPKYLDELRLGRSGG
jgi:excisionase family DNA binding protein